MLFNVQYFYSSTTRFIRSIGSTEDNLKSIFVENLQNDSLLFDILSSSTTTTTTTMRGIFDGDQPRVRRRLFEVFSDTGEVDNSAYLNLTHTICLNINNLSSQSNDPIVIIQPKRSEKYYSIPYDYTLWQTSYNLPRSVTPCEHSIMMKLLLLFDKLCRKYKIQYMMIDGTLLGSYRHHDIIPWDDDIDLLMSVKDKRRLNRAIHKHLIRSHKKTNDIYNIEYFRRWDPEKLFEYYKFYFLSSLKLSTNKWKWPFVDLIFYHENRTHLWHENNFQFTVQKLHIFPLTLRPLGHLWLPAPQSPLDYFESVKYLNVDQECFSQNWSHKYEQLKENSMVACDTLKHIYPFVERNCTKVSCQESLLLNGKVVHVAIIENVAEKESFA
ncbi:unnamed protein product [Didymodactylos carnosus]|uniref:LicD/FKTN/FKRP nucleotidyltransferase domain-containing protein n=1 Tax=Didymodactylos carnosus TaxID=1234261 RepID=A0A815MGY8_9BILA|nr:unnamed protein product [Didymodactylos carnosus]CAF1420486.1 unnamed protein product [Didymodactylos carnosus]CAF3558881.1 unnamed protein product [Didymodactylos carnosus]CAF4303956.1 unnamed protein product [Didymodactylos carnosus]